MIEEVLRQKMKCDLKTTIVRIQCKMDSVRNFNFKSIFNFKLEIILITDISEMFVIQSKI